MIHTFNGCSRSNFTVSPANWKTAKASTKKPWRIFYRFYDPAYKEDPKVQGMKACVNRDMNTQKDLRDRQDVTRELLKNEADLIDAQGYNPITGCYMAPAEELEEADQPIRPDTPVIKALNLTLPLLDIAEDTRTDIKSVLKYFGQSAQKLGKDKVPIKDLRRGEIIAILDNCANLTVKEIKKKETHVRKKVWNANQFNHYRKYLSLLYGHLDFLEILEYNPIEKIPLKEGPEDEAKAPRAILTDEQAVKIELYLRTSDPFYHRWIHIFFHSGARRNEIMRVKGKDVELRKGGFWVMIKKRKKRKRVWKTIKDIAMPFWVQAMEGCGPDDYVFSVGLKPGARPIRPEQVTRRWQRHIKTLGIVADLYALKHKNTTEQVDILIEQESIRLAAVKAAAEHNSHTSEAMVVKIYDVNQERRRHYDVKGIDNSFGGTK